MVTVLELSRYEWEVLKVQNIIDMETLVFFCGEHRILICKLNINDFPSKKLKCIVWNTLAADC